MNEIYTDEGKRFLSLDEEQGENKLVRSGPCELGPSLVALFWV